MVLFYYLTVKLPYIVEKGDTLAIISRKMYGDLNHVDAICRMNGITDGNLIYVGQKLLLP